MCFEGDNDCTKTVSEYANSISMSLRAMHVRAKWRKYPYDMWKYTVMKQGEYNDWYASSTLVLLFLLNVILELCSVSGL